MEIIQANSYEDALSEVQKRKAPPAGADMRYKIIESGYGGYVIIAVAQDLFADILIDGHLAIHGRRRSHNIRGDFS